MTDNEQFAVAEAAFIEDPDLAAYKHAGFSNVKTGELVVVYLCPDTDRYMLKPDGTIATLYTGYRLDASTLLDKGAARRSNDPEDLRRWWQKVTGQPSSSPALKQTSDEEKGSQ